jgi:hypothetical protein
VLVCAVMRRHLRVKREDSRASTTRGRAGSAGWRPRSTLSGPVSARCDGFDADIRPLIRTIRPVIAGYSVYAYRVFGGKAADLEYW